MSKTVFVQDKHRKKPFLMFQKLKLVLFWQFFMNVSHIFKLCQHNIELAIYALKPKIFYFYGTFFRQKRQNFARKRKN